MNNENRYPVTASLYMLREIKHRQAQVNRGYQLLKRKAEALRFRGRQAANELAAVQAILGHTLREAYISLAAVKFTNGESNALVLENIGEAQVRVLRIPENVSGVTTVALQPIEDPTASDTLRYAGLGAGGHRTTEAKKAFREAVRILIKFASLRNTCIILDDAIRGTLRKVNGIEKVIVPKLRNTESYILTEMDEREREEFHRLKMVKAKKVHQALACATRTAAEGARDPPDFKEIDDVLTGLSAVRHEFVFYTIRNATMLSVSTSESSGDFTPACLPHNWDDDDLIF